MNWLLAYVEQFLVFILVLTRLSGLMMTLPAIGSREVPLRVRALLAVGIAMLITPMFWGKSAVHAETMVNLLTMLGREALLGLSLGLAVQIVVGGLQLAGSIISQMSGMALAEVFDPTFEGNVPVFSQLLDLTTVAVFFGIGGHRHLMTALLDSFYQLPPGSGGIPHELLEALTIITGNSFATALRAAGPVMVALLMSVLILGLISRTLPQLNVLAVGFSLNGIVVLAMTAIGFGAVSLVFQEQIDLAVQRVYVALVSVQP